MAMFTGTATPKGRWQQGMGLLSEDRTDEGLALGLDIASNLTMTRLSSFGPAGLLSPARQRAAASRWIKRLQIKCAGPDQSAGELSGGNQQKIAIARLLHHDVDVLLLDEPTRGIDVGSKAQIYRLIDELVASAPGRTPKAVLMVSSYLPELLGLCDRIAVMHRGQLSEPRPGRNALRARADDGGNQRGTCRMTTRTLIERGGTFLGLILVAIIFGALVGPQFFSPNNLELMARQTAIVSIAAVGMTVVIVSGGIDLSVGSIIALGTVVIALLLRSGASPLVAALGAIAAAAACGLVNGVLITQLRVVPFIVTLGTMLVIRGAAKGLAEERRIEAPVKLAERSAAGAARRGPAPFRHLGGHRARAHRRRCSALHAFRPPCVCDRIQRAHGAAVRRRDHAHEGPRLRAHRERLPVSPVCCSFQSCRWAIRPSRSASNST